MIQEVVKGWAVQRVGDGVYIHYVFSHTSYSSNCAPCVFSTRLGADALMNNYIDKGFMGKVEVVEVEYVIKMKSWVKYADPDMYAWVYSNNPSHVAYMCALRKMMKEGVVRLGESGQWEVYQ